MANEFTSVISSSEQQHKNNGTKSAAVVIDCCAISSSTGMNIDFNQGLVSGQDQLDSPFGMEDSQASPIADCLLDKKKQSHYNAQRKLTCSSTKAVAKDLLQELSKGEQSHHMNNDSSSNDAGNILLSLL